MKRRTLYASVFVSGLAILIMEVVGVRILKQRFGDTSYVVSSVLTVILAGLAVGYFAGGRVADRHPKPGWFFGLLLFGGVGVAVVPVLDAVVVGSLVEASSTRSGPMLASLALFALPSTLSGAASPFAVRLGQGAGAAGVGKVSGDVFFWGTLGSITGGLAGGYLLLPALEAGVVLGATGAFLMLVGLVGLAFASRSRRRRFLVALALSARHFRG